MVDEAARARLGALCSWPESRAKKPSGSLQRYAWRGVRGTLPVCPVPSPRSGEVRRRACGRCRVLRLCGPGGPGGRVLLCCSSRGWHTLFLHEFLRRLQQHDPRMSLCPLAGVVPGARPVVAATGARLDPSSVSTRPGPMSSRVARLWRSSHPIEQSTERVARSPRWHPSSSLVLVTQVDVESAREG